MIFAFCKETTVVLFPLASKYLNYLLSEEDELDAWFAGGVWIFLEALAPAAVNITYTYILNIHIQNTLLSNLVNTEINPGTFKYK